MIRLATGALGFSLALIVASPALAQNAPRDRGQPMADLTRADAAARADAMFARLDANNDGRIDAADREARQRAVFARLDANGDGALSLSEFGALRAELEARRGEPLHPGLAERRAMAGPGLRGALMPLRRGAMADGQPITAEAFREAALARFDRADANGDGVLTAAERRALRGMAIDRRRIR